MIEEYLSYLQNNPSQKIMILNYLQRYLDNNGMDNNSNYNFVRNGLLKYSQDEKDTYLFSELLIWLFMNHNEFNLAYAQAVLYAEAMQNIYGDDIFINIIENLKNNVNFTDIIYILTNKNIAQLEISIQDYLKNKYRWIQLINFTDLLFSIMPLLLVIGFIIKSFKVKKIKKQWEIEEELEDLMSS